MKGNEGAPRGFAGLAGLVDKQNLGDFPLSPQWLGLGKLPGGPDKAIVSSSGELPSSANGGDEKWTARQAAGEDRPVTSTDKWAGGSLDALDARNQNYFPPPRAAADNAPQSTRSRWNDGAGAGAGRVRDLTRWTDDNPTRGPDVTLSRGGGASSQPDDWWGTAGARPRPAGRGAGKWAPDRDADEHKSSNLDATDKAKASKEPWFKGSRDENSTWRAKGDTPWRGSSNLGNDYLAPGSGKGFDAGRGRGLRPTGAVTPAAPGSTHQPSTSPGKKYTRSDMEGVLHTLKQTVGEKLPLPAGANRAAVTHDVWDAGPATADSGSTEQKAVSEQDVPPSIALNGVSHDSAFNKSSAPVSMPPGFAAPSMPDMLELEQVGIRNCVMALAVDKYQYRDPQGQVQGPFERQQLLNWYSQSYLPPDLATQAAPPVHEPAEFYLLSQFLTLWMKQAQLKISQQALLTHVQRQQSSQLTNAAPIDIPLRQPQPQPQPQPQHQLQPQPGSSMPFGSHSASLSQSVDIGAVDAIQRDMQGFSLGSLQSNHVEPAPYSPWGSMVPVSHPDSLNLNHGFAEQQMHGMQYNNIQQHNAQDPVLQSRMPEPQLPHSLDPGQSSPWRDASAGSHQLQQPQPQPQQLHEQHVAMQQEMERARQAEAAAAWQVAGQRKAAPDPGPGSGAALLGTGAPAALAKFGGPSLDSWGSPTPAASQPREQLGASHAPEPHPLWAGTSPGAIHQLHQQQQPQPQPQQPQPQQPPQRQQQPQQLPQQQQQQQQQRPQQPDQRGDADAWLRKLGAGQVPRTTGAPAAAASNWGAPAPAAAQGAPVKSLKQIQEEEKAALAQKQAEAAAQGPISGTGSRPRTATTIGDFMGQFSQQQPQQGAWGVPTHATQVPNFRDLMDEEESAADLEGGRYYEASYQPSPPQTGWSAAATVPAQMPSLRDIQRQEEVNRSQSQAPQQPAQDSGLLWDYGGSTNDQPAQPTQPRQANPPPARSTTAASIVARGASQQAQQPPPPPPQARSAWATHASKPAAQQPRQQAAAGWQTSGNAPAAAQHAPAAPRSEDMDPGMKAAIEASLKDQENPGSLGHPLLVNNPDFREWCTQKMAELGGTMDLIAFLLSVDGNWEVQDTATTYLGNKAQVSSFVAEFIRRKNQAAVAKAGGKKKKKNKNAQTTGTQATAAPAAAQPSNAMDVMGMDDGWATAGTAAGKNRRKQATASAAATTSANPFHVLPS